MKILAYEHLGERTGKIHIHLPLVNTSVDKKQLRNIAATTKIPVSGNEWMSFKVADLEPTYITYMSKGQIDPSYNKGYTEAELEEYKHKWVNQKSAVKLTEDDKIIEGWIKYYEHDLCGKPRGIQHDTGAQFLCTTKRSKVIYLEQFYKGRISKMES